MNHDAMDRQFLDECSEAVTTMETVLVQFPVGPTPPGALDAVFRIAHSIKGGASTLGLAQLASVSHSLESLLDAMRGQRIQVSRETLGVLLRSVDVLRALLAAGRDNAAMEMQAIVDLQLELERLAVGEPTGTGVHAVDREATTSIRILGAGDAGIASRPTVRVDAELIDSLVAAITDLVRQQRTLEARTADLPDDSRAHLGEPVRDLRQVVGELERRAVELSTVPVGVLFRRFPRMVRDLATRLGKQVELRIDGGDVGIDKAVVEPLGDALVQLIRNALDHGIETPAQRRCANKPEVGHLWLRAETRGTSVAIEVGEDGAGLAREAIRRKAARGPSADGAPLTDAEVDALIFLPGLTTVDAPTDISGRGVGMDVVNRSLQSVGASIEVQSEPGQGCRFRLLIPCRRTPVRLSGHAGTADAAAAR